MSMSFSIRHRHNLQTHTGVDVGDRGPLLGRIHHHIGHLAPLIHGLVPGRTGLIIGDAAHHHGGRRDCHGTERGSRYRRTNDHASDSPGRIGAAGTIPSITVTMVIIGPVLPVFLLLLPVVLPVLLLLLSVALSVFAIGRLRGLATGLRFLGGGLPAGLLAATLRLHVLGRGLAARLIARARGLAAFLRAGAIGLPVPTAGRAATAATATAATAATAEVPATGRAAAGHPTSTSTPPPLPTSSPTSTPPPRWASTGTTTNTPIKTRPLQAVQYIHRCARIALTVLSLGLHRAACSAAGQRRSSLPPRVG